jgi:magnesium transporter
MAQSSAYQTVLSPQTTSQSKRLSPDMAGDDFMNDPISENAALLSTSLRVRRTGSGFPAPSYGTVESRRPRSPKECGQSSRSRPSNLVATESYNINYPPSVPGTPTLGPTDRLDMMMRDEFSRGGGSPRRHSSFDGFSSDDHEGDSPDDKHDSHSVDPHSSPSSPTASSWTVARPLSPRRLESTGGAS